jgi:hypothetical protein
MINQTNGFLHQHVEFVVGRKKKKRIIKQSGITKQKPMQFNTLLGYSLYCVFQLT